MGLCAGLRMQGTTARAQTLTLILCFAARKLSLVRRRRRRKLSPLRPVEVSRATKSWPMFAFDAGGGTKGTARVLEIKLKYSVCNETFRVKYCLEEFGGFCLLADLVKVKCIQQSCVR